MDTRVDPGQPALAARAIVPDYALGPHTVSLGLASSVGSSLPAPFVGGILVGQHRSWNRRPHSGDKVVLPFAGGRAAGRPFEVLSGFLSADGKAPGRPVGVAIDKQGHCWWPTPSATRSGA